MVTTSTWGRRALFHAEPWSRLIIDTLYHYRGSAYLLHEFVIMPDHIHVLLTPLTSLEKAVQFIKGGFSYRAKKELGSNLEVWQKGVFGSSYPRRQ
jgi:REP-associated tyrosine transposase